MPTSLTFDDHLTALDAAGSRLVELAEKAGLDAPVPTCPAWDGPGVARPPGDGAPLGGRQRARRRRRRPAEPDRDPHDRRATCRRTTARGMPRCSPRSRAAPADLDGDDVPERRPSAAPVLGPPPGARDDDPHGRRARRRPRPRARPPARSTSTLRSPPTASTSCCAASSPGAVEAVRRRGVRDRRRGLRRRPALDRASRRAPDGGTGRLRRRRRRRRGGDDHRVGRRALPRSVEPGRRVSRSPAGRSSSTAGGRPADRLELRSPVPAAAVDGDRVDPPRRPRPVPGGGGGAATP